MSHPSLGSTLRKLFPLYSLIAFELVSLRVLFHHFLNIQIGWPGTTDFDLAMPFTVAFFAFFHALTHTPTFKIHFEKKMLSIHLSFQVLLIALTLALHSLGLFSNSVCKAAWFATLGGIIFSGLHIFFAARFYLHRSGRWTGLP
ncbi:MAG: hypothetical protein EB120_09945, partial [Proteobacteria bacterium]|nr:hypothetical protein [Pseudomonadota bacterium]